jgi:hypothetical protein
MRIAMSAKIPLTIIETKLLDEDTIGVSYSDLTTVVYTADQLKELIPLAVFEKTKLGTNLRIN